MKKQIFKPTFLTTARAFLMPLLFMSAVVAFISAGLYQTEAMSRGEELNLLEEGLIRAAVKCYAAEGKYPEDLSYIEENYGIHINKERYIVNYGIFASNIFPDITVIELD